MLIKLKWKILRYLVKCDEISFLKMMIRMFCIQELEKINYDEEKLAKLSYRRIRKIYIKEFPNKYLPNPNIK